MLEDSSNDVIAAFMDRDLHPRMLGIYLSKSLNFQRPG